jgi:predicted nucleotide-binding protein (sugar kinase/HSP70/actin superfamily)
MRETPVPGVACTAGDHDETTIQRTVAAAASRFEARVGLPPERPPQYRRPPERPFTAEERDRVTVLFGGLPWKHDRLVEATLESCGHLAEALPQPDLEACLIGRQYCNNGVCNPAYFTVGNLVRHLQRLEATGLTRQEIVDRYVFFTAGACGPCRFGTYEAEYRLALRNAGFDGFRILTFSQSDGVKADTGEPGLKLSLHFGLGALNAITVADALNGLGYAVRPYETVPGSTDEALVEAIDTAARIMAARRPVPPSERIPAWVRRRHPGLAKTWDVIRHVRSHISRPVDAALVAECATPFAGIEVDWLRVKPIVKVTGEFWAQTTEGDGNFTMFAFLEREGAEVLVEPVSGWVMYLLNHAREEFLYKRGLGVPRSGPALARWRAQWREAKRVTGRKLLFWLGEALYHRHYDNYRAGLGGVPRPLVDQRELVRLSSPFYHRLARGGEGYTEVAKTIYYGTRSLAHMVLGLKPFGCMPSSQSDGVQSAVVAHFKDLMYVPIETAADGELNAHSRVQMALVEARARAQAEFDEVLGRSGCSLDDVRAYVGAHPELRSPFFHVPRHPGVTGTAANFVLHVSRRIGRRRVRIVRARAGIAPRGVVPGVTS